jgi:hypothetical protein
MPIDAGFSSASHAHELILLVLYPPFAYVIDCSSLTHFSLPFCLTSPLPCGTDLSVCLCVCVSCPAEADTETKAQTKQYNAIINEQRVLNQQLITRNSELTQLYEKLKVQHSLLKMGESTYKDKVATVRSLQTERDELVLRVQDSVGDEGEFDFMKETIISIEDQLVQEKLRVRALEAELQQPMNVHRWRRLQDTDTEKFGLLQSVQVCHTQLVAGHSLHYI